MQGAMTSSRRTVLLVLVAAAVSGVLWMDPRSFLASGETSYRRALGYQQQQMHDRADGLFRAACRRGHANGCLEAGEGALTGTGRARDVEDALWFFGKACDLGRGMACARLAKAFQPGGEGEPNAVKAAAFAGRAEAAYTADCDRGEPSGCFLLGRLLLREDRTKEAVERFRSGCAAGSVASCLLAAMQYRTGKLVADEPGVALGLYEKACTTYDSAVDCCAAGTEYSVGRSVTADEAAATRFFAMSCEGGTLEACMRVWRTAPAVSSGVRRAAARFLGACPRAASSAATCSEPCGSSDDSPTAGAKASEQELDELCAAGDLLACHGAGLFAGRHERGHARSVGLHEKACVGGLAMSCSHAAESYELGVSVERNAARARELLEKGCAAGSRRACSRLGPRGPKRSATSGGTRDAPA